MVQMVPNVAMINGTISKITQYDQSPGFSILVVTIKDAAQKKDANYLYNKETDKEIKVMISDQKKNELKLKPKDNIEAEVKKVNIDLWRADETKLKVR